MRLLPTPVHLIIAYLVIQASVTVFAAKESPNNYGLLGQGKTFSARVMSKGTLFLGTSFIWAQSDGRVCNQEIYFPRTGADSVLTRSNFGEFTFKPFISTAFTRFMEFSLTIPLYKDFTETLDPANPSTVNPNVKETDAFGLGDTEAALKLQYPFKHHRIFDVALLGKVSFPTGSTQKGFFPKDILFIPKGDTVGGEVALHEMYTANNVSYTGLLALTFNFENFIPPLPLEFSVNYGFTVSQNKNLDMIRIFNTALEYYFTYASIFVDFSSQTRLQKYRDGYFKNWGDDPMFLSTGVAFSVGYVQFSFALDTDLSYMLAGDSTHSKGVEAINIDRDGDGENAGTYYLKPMKYGVSFKIVWRGLFY